MRILGMALAIMLPHATIGVAATRLVPSQYPTIQAALNASTGGDQVLVAPGTYGENLVIAPAQAGVVLQSLGGPDVTIVDGGNGGTVLTIVGAGAGTVVSGFTLQHGGVVNPAAVIGGGLYLSYCAAHIEGNIITDNHAAAAGGAYIDGGAPTVRSNTFRGNAAPFGSGGAIYCDHFTAATIDHNLIVNNSCSASGGGLTIWEGSLPVVTGNTFDLNQASRGGGVFVTRNSHPVLRRNIIASSPAGGGVWVDDTESTLVLECNDVWGNSPNYFGIADPTGGSGNLTADPQFCDASGADLHPAVASPCAAANSPAFCGLIGALEATCQRVAAARMTWGQLKSNYR